MCVCVSLPITFKASSFLLHKDTRGRDKVRLRPKLTGMDYSAAGQYQVVVGTNANC